MPARLGTPLYHEEDRGFKSPCWICDRYKNTRGYASISSKTGPRIQRAHRWFYERVKGPIPKGLTLDHLCRQRDCVNPDHLDPVTVAENCRRGLGSKLGHHGVFTARLASVSTTLTQREIGEMLGVTQGAISRAIRGESWA